MIRLFQNSEKKLCAFMEMHKSLATWRIHIIVSFPEKPRPFPATKQFQGRFIWNSITCPHLLRFYLECFPLNAKAHQGSLYPLMGKSKHVDFFLAEADTI